MSILKNIVAIILILGGLFGGQAIDYINTPSVPEVNLLSVTKPNQDVLSEVESVANLVTDQEDKIKVAIFNFQFAKNVIGYESSVQQANDIYTLAGKIFFKDELVGKYPGFGEGLISMISSVTSNDNHILSQEEKDKISEKFIGLTWVLLQ